MSLSSRVAEFGIGIEDERAAVSGHDHAIAHGLDQIPVEALVEGSVDEGPEGRAVAQTGQRIGELGSAEVQVLLAPQNGDGKEISARAVVDGLDVEEEQLVGRARQGADGRDRGPLDPLGAAAEPILMTEEFGQYVALELGQLAAFQRAGEIAAGRRQRDEFRQRIGRLGVPAGASASGASRNQKKP